MSKALDKSINISVLFPLFRLVLGQLPPEENFLPTPKLTLIQSLTLTRGHFSSGAIVWLPPPPRTLKLTLTLTETAPLSVGQFSSGGGGGEGGVLDYFPNFQSYLAVHAVHYGSCEILFTYLENLSLIICINLRVNKFFKDF